MKIPPDYKITPKILEIITKIEANRIFLEALSLSSDVTEKIKRVSFLKSSLFSARIEGNPLTLATVDESDDTLRKIEVFNILEAFKYIEKEVKPETKITRETVSALHRFVLKNISSSGGFFRKEAGAIFNQAGVAVYLSPPPESVSPFINSLVNYINAGIGDFPLVTAFISHLMFEKIHPFIDGNGRVGRLLIFTILKKKNWHYPIFVPLEEYLDEHKDDYYYYLDVGLKNPTGYLEFMLEAFLDRTEKMRKELGEKSQKEEKLFLPPRQEEIYRIIKEHKNISLDFIKRRFLKVPERTLRYDLKKLQEKNIIVKIGTTKGVYYCAK